MRRRSIMAAIAALIAARRVTPAPALASGGLASGAPMLVGEAVPETILPLARGEAGRLGVSDAARAKLNADLRAIGTGGGRYDGSVCMPIGEFRDFMRTRQPDLTMRRIAPGASLPFSVPPECIGPLEHGRISDAARAGEA